MINDRYGEAASAMCEALGGADFIGRLERELSAMTKKSVAATVSADGALHAALHVLGVKRGDYVFLPSFAFYCCAATVEHAGGVPVFLDCDPVTRCVSPSALETAFVWAELQNKPPAAVVIDDAFGSVADYDVLVPMCASRNVPVIEFAVDALGGSYRGIPCGANGRMGVISFSKRLNGSGGALVCEKDDLPDVRKFIRAEYGDGESHEYKMHNIIAALDFGLMGAFEKIVARAKTNLAAVCKEVDCIQPVAGDAGAYAFIRTADASALEKAGFTVKRVTPVHTLPKYSDSPFFEHEPDFSACMSFSDRVLVDMDISLPKRLRLISILKKRADI